MTEITPIYFYPEYSRTPDAALLREAIRFSQWSVGASNGQHYYVEVFEPGLPGVVPVGTVENIHGHIEKYTDRKPPPPMVDGPKNEPPREVDVIECHHFYACGLYGMDAPAHLLMMTSGWWKWFLREGEERGNDTTNE